jgi:hypothetical protein
VTRPAMDERDWEIVRVRQRARDLRTGPQVGDWVIFQDGAARRVAYRWTDGAGAGWDGGVQTAVGGSWHLGEHGFSYGGTLYMTVPTDSLQPVMVCSGPGEITELRWPAAAWIFPPRPLRP